MNKYFEGSTTTGEEKILKRYFASGEVAPQFEPYRELFSHFEDQHALTLGDDFDDELMQQISSHRTIPLHRTRRFWYYFSGVAASILFVLALLFESQHTSTRSPLAGSGYTREETQQAYRQVKTALAFVSEKYVQGVAPLSNVSQLGNTAAILGELGKFDQGLDDLDQNVQTVEKIDQSVDNLSKLSKFTIIVKP